VPAHAAGEIRIGFLHTSPVHTSTFDRLVADIDPDLETVVVVDESLLNRARRAGPTHPDVVDGIAAALDKLELAGASTIVCTCSTIGGEAEDLGVQRDIDVARVDRAMAESAVATGTRIAVVAALESTFDPTMRLLESVASSRGVSIDLTTVLCEGAWSAFEAGQRDRYLRAVATTCASLDGSYDVIVLAQASMADAALLFDGSTTILSSPALAVEAAVRSAQNRLDRGADR
jgi:hypothetical protein